MTFRGWRLLLAVAMFAMVCGTATTALGQTLTGQIGGTVVDSSKGVLPGATVTVKNEATATTVTAVTDANGAFLITNLIAGRYEHHGVARQLQDATKPKGIVLRPPSACRSPPITLEVGGLTETVTVQAEALKVQTQSGERSAVITAEQIEDIGLRGRDFMGTLKIAARRRRHVRARRTRLGLGRRHDRQRPGLVQLLVRRRDEQGHGLEQRQLRGAGARLDRRSQAAGLELPGRVRPHVGRDDRRRHQERQLEVPGSAAYFRRNEDFNANTWDRRRSCDANPVVNGAAQPELQQAAVPLQQHGVDDRRPGPDSGHRRSTGAATSCSSSSRRTCCRARTRAACSDSTMPTSLERAGDFSQTVDNQGVLRFIRDPRKTGHVRRQHGRRRGVLRRQHHPVVDDQPDRPDHPEHVPDAERDRPVGHAAVQLRV